MENRSQVITFRVTPSEKVKIQRLAETLRRGQSDAIRFVLMHSIVQDGTLKASATATSN